MLNRSVEVEVCIEKLKKYLVIDFFRGIFTEEIVNLTNEIFFDRDTFALWFLTIYG